MTAGTTQVFSRFAPFGRIKLTEKSWAQVAAELQHYLEALAQSIAGSHTTQTQLHNAMTGTVNFIPKWGTVDSFIESHMSDDGFVILALSPTSFADAPTTGNSAYGPKTFVGNNQYTGAEVTAQHPALYNGVPGNNYVSGVAGVFGSAFGNNAGTNIGVQGYGQNLGTGDAVGGLFMAPFFLGLPRTAYSIGVIAKGGNPTVNPSIGGAFGLGSTEAILLENAVILGDTCHSFDVPLLLLKHAGVELASIRPVVDTGGTKNFFKVNGTLPGANTAPLFANYLNITSAGSAAFSQRALMVKLLAGYTGAAECYAIRGDNFADGTQNVDALAGGGDIGVGGYSTGTTTGSAGSKMGVFGYALNNGTGKAFGVVGSIHDIGGGGISTGYGVTGLLNPGNHAGSAAGLFTLGGGSITIPVLPETAVLVAADNTDVTTTPIFQAVTGHTTPTVVFAVTAAGGLRVKDASVGTGTLGPTNHVIRGDATAGAITYTLPVIASGNLGTWYRIKKIDSSANTVTITAGGGNTIEGAASIILAAQWDSVDVFAPSTGTDWILFGRSGSSIGVGADDEARAMALMAA